MPRSSLSQDGGLGRWSPGPAPTTFRSYWREVDALIEKASATTDEAARAALQRQAANMALQDGAIVPLLHLNVAWAMRKNIVITPRADAFTRAMDIRAK
ncbi:MAG TPA: hypothetical protein VF616_07035 [Duganella sp.]|uniref:hypothetical protein n=1 Tax=Duganella sp. TaxID=1904440 RepID=UPI002ED19D6A